MRAFLETPHRPFESAPSFFRLSLAKPSVGLSVIFGPNILVKHSRLFALTVGKCFCYFGPRQTVYGNYDLPLSQIQWNEAIEVLHGQPVVEDAAVARSLAALLLAFATGGPIAPRPGIFDYELDLYEAPGGPLLPDPVQFEGPTIVHRLGDDWIVSGKWQRWIFRARFRPNGAVSEFTLE